MFFHKIFKLLRAPFCPKHKTLWPYWALFVVNWQFVCHLLTSAPYTNAFLYFLHLIGKFAEFIMSKQGLSSLRVCFWLRFFSTWLFLVRFVIQLSPSKSPKLVLLVLIFTTYLSLHLCPRADPVKYCSLKFYSSLKSANQIGIKCSCDSFLVNSSIEWYSTL